MAGANKPRDETSVTEVKTFLEARRQTKNKGITILQGRTVGGSTTVNWTSSFRTPITTLKHWETVYGLTDYTAEKLAPWFAKMEN